MVRVHTGLNELGDGHPQPLLLLRGQRAQIAQDARHWHSLRVLKTEENVSRLASECTAHQFLDVALIFHQVSQMILSAPRCSSGNITRRCRALQVLWAQPLKKRHDLRLRCRKSVQNLCASWHDCPPSVPVRMWVAPPDR